MYQAGHAFTAQISFSVFYHDVKEAYLQSKHRTIYDVYIQNTEVN